MFDFLKEDITMIDESRIPNFYAKGFKSFYEGFK